MEARLISEQFVIDHLAWPKLNVVSFILTVAYPLYRLPHASPPLLWIQALAARAAAQIVARMA
jgi:hypothetical protein